MKSTKTLHTITFTLEQYEELHQGTLDRAIQAACADQHCMTVAVLLDQVSADAHKDLLVEKMDFVPDGVERIGNQTFVRFKMQIRSAVNADPLTIDITTPSPTSRVERDAIARTLAAR